MWLQQVIACISTKNKYENPNMANYSSCLSYRIAIYLFCFFNCLFLLACYYYSFLPHQIRFIYKLINENLGIPTFCFSLSPNRIICMLHVFCCLTIFPYLYVCTYVKLLHIQIYLRTQYYSSLVSLEFSTPPRHSPSFIYLFISCIKERWKIFFSSFLL